MIKNIILFEKKKGIHNNFVRLNIFRSWRNRVVVYKWLMYSV